ncbi:MAG: hypothetical protein II539_04365 [Muribaculaceae bacterium]|nr:hypothetical protein [Muribaculaceae bacterium]
MKRFILLSITVIFVSIFSLSSDMQTKGTDFARYLSNIKADSISLELTLPFYHTQLIVNITPCKQEIEYYFHPKSSLFCHPDDSIAPLNKAQSLQLLSEIDSLYISKQKKVCEKIVKGELEMDQTPPPPDITIRIYRTRRKTIEDVISLKDLGIRREDNVTFKVFSKTFLHIVDTLYSLAQQGGLMEYKREPKALIRKY